MTARTATWALRRRDALPGFGLALGVTLLWLTAGIGCSVHYIPLHQQPYWRDRYGLRAEQFPHSQRAYERLFSLPIYTRMTDADVQRVVAVLRRLLG